MVHDTDWGLELTALLSRNGTNFTLACDGCGQLVTDLASSMGNWDVTWSLFSQDGWTGDPLATGPHMCDRCTRTPPPPPRMVEEALRREGGTPSRRQSRRLTVTSLNDVTVVTLTGTPDLPMNALLRDLSLAIAGQHRHLIVDVGNLSRLDSGTVDVLVQARRRSSLVCLIAPSQLIVDSLRLLCLHDVLPTFTDPMQALVWIRGGLPGAPGARVHQRAPQDDRIAAR